MLSFAKLSYKLPKIKSNSQKIPNPVIGVNFALK